MDSSSLENITVCYLCCILDEQTKTDRGILADSPAATKKVLDVSCALKNRVRHMYVLSLGRGKQIAHRGTHAATVKQLSGIPVLYAHFSPIPFVTYLISSFSLIPLMLRIRKKANGGSIHIIAYNRQWLYLPVLFMSKLLRMKCYLDLEDSSLIEGVSLLKFLLFKLNKFIFNHLCEHGSILVHPGLIDQVKTKHNVICYGVATKHEDTMEREWNDKEIHFLLGGSLLPETGIFLLLDAVRILNSKYSSYKGRIIIDVTGYGDVAELAKLSTQEGQGWIVFHGRVSGKQYNTLLTQSHVGLCLKLPSSEMGITTFPSKVIEIASFGKLLLTTRLGHVYELFGDDGACYLSDENSSSLAEMIVSIVNHPLTSKKSAYIGKNRVLRTCNATHIADDICSLFEGTLD